MERACEEAGDQDQGGDHSPVQRKDEKTWKRLRGPDREVICVDLELGKGQELLNPHVAWYLYKVCQSGRVRAVIGGPVSTTPEDQVRS